MPDEAAALDEKSVRISDSATKRIAHLVEQEGNERLMLRIAISGGGCSGFQYGFSLDDKTNDDDSVFEENGVRVVVDEVSLDMLNGSELDYVDDLIGSYFSLSNPNATATCGCGTSFAV